MSSASVAVSEPEPLSHVAVRARRVLPEERGRDAHERQHDERGEREAPVEEEQDDDRPEQRQRVLDQAREAVGDELVERLDVVRQPADDHACAVSLVEAEREPLQVAEERVPQVGQDPLARPAREVRLRRGRQDGQEAGQDEERDDPPQRLDVLLVDAVVDRELPEIRRHEADCRRREQRADRERRSLLVRGREPREGRDSPDRRLPRPVVDLRASLLGQMAARLPDPHAVASTRSANSRSSRPCS